MPAAHQKASFAFFRRFFDALFEKTPYSENSVVFMQKPENTKMTELRHSAGEYCEKQIVLSHGKKEALKRSVVKFINC